jgi:hypothetical protein
VQQRGEVVHLQWSAGRNHARMPHTGPTIISDAPPRTRQLVLLVFAATLVVGGAAAVDYAWHGLTLSHYDARAHLVVARRVIDNLTPGWRQLGAVWLPLPHLIQILPTQWDWNFRTGYLSAGMSVVELAVGLAALAGYLYRYTKSAAAALVAPAIVLVNPDVLYLQSTPMTEPLLFGLSFCALAAVAAWIEHPDQRHLHWAGGVLVALMWTRYEGWCVGVALVVLATLEGWRRGTRRPWALAPYAVFAIVAFLFLGWGATGRWFVTSGFFVPDNPSFHRPFAAMTEVATSTMALGGVALVVVGVAGALVCLIAARRSIAAALPVALLAAAALPLAAFFQGHPHRVRYMVPLVVAAGALAAYAVAALPRRVQGWAAAALCALVMYQRPPLDAHAPMVMEAQWETPYRLGRRAVSAYLDANYDGTLILASMGSLAHYMQETAAHGLRISNYLHEGNGDLWSAAVARPRLHVEWILIEERAEGGDVLAARAKDDASFLDGFTRVAEGGGLALYRRTAPPVPAP